METVTRFFRIEPHFLSRDPGNTLVVGDNTASVRKSVKGGAANPALSVCGYENVYAAEAAPHQF